MSVHEIEGDKAVYCVRKHTLPRGSGGVLPKKFLVFCLHVVHSWVLINCSEKTSFLISEALSR